MILLMVLAQLYGVLQFALLGWAARTVRLRVLLLAVLGGMYAAAPVAVLLQVGWTRAFAAVSGEPLFEVTSRASYTVDPFIEECVKVAPLLLLWLAVRSVRRQWGATDFVLVGAALGAGFGLAEDLLRFADQAGRAIHLATGGWVIPVGLSAPTVPGVRQTLTSWLPAGVGSGGLLGGGPADAIDVHLVWSCVAALGLALVFRGGRSRTWLIGLGLLALAGADHAAFNTEGIAGKLATTLAAPFGAARAVVWAYPLAALAAAVWLDRRTLSSLPRPAAAGAPPAPGPGAAPAPGSSGVRAPAPGSSGVRAPWPGAAPAASTSRAPAAAPAQGVVLDCERRAPVRSLGLARLGIARPPWSTQAVWGFVRLRRGYLLSGRDGEPEAALGQAIGLIAPALDRAAGQAGPRVWREAVQRLSTARAAGGRRWPAAADLLTTRPGRRVAVWLLLLVPPVLYFLVGGVPSLAAVQRALTSRHLSWVVVAAALAGAVWTAWSLVAGARRLADARRHPAADVPAAAMLRLLVRGGSLLVSLIGFWLLLRGHSPTDPLLAGAHILDAVGQALLILGLLLALAAIAVDPPFALAPLAGGGAELAWTGLSAALAGNLVVSGVIGGIGVALMEGGDDPGTSDDSGTGEDGAGSGQSGSAAEAGQGGQEPVPGLPYTADELAQLAYRHAGAGELAERPTLEQIRRTLSSVEGKPIPGQNAVRFDYQGVRVIINRDLPWRSTAYFPGS